MNERLHAYRHTHTHKHTHTLTHSAQTGRAGDKRLTQTQPRQVTSADALDLKCKRARLCRVKHDPVNYGELTTSRTHASNLSCIPVSAPGDGAGHGRRLVCSPVSHLSLLSEGRASSKLSPTLKTCAAAFCSSLRRTIQLPGIPAQRSSRSDSRDSRAPVTTAAHTPHLHGKIYSRVR